MGKRQNRVVPILLLGNHAMSAKKDANSPSRDTKNTERTRSVNFNNLIYVNCTREQKTYFMPINFCLLNTRSINRKELFINDYVSENDINILAMTETWLREDDNEFSIAEICPTGYHFCHVTRKNARGGGVGLLLKKYIKSKNNLRENSLLLNILISP